MLSLSRCSTHTSDLRSRLREATSTAHAAVDSAFVGGLRDDAQYIRYLHAMHGVLSALEPAWQPWRAHGDWAGLIAPPRAPLLQRDLAQLGIDARPAAPLRVDNEAALLGTLYVIQGSAMGARLLRRTRPPNDPAACFLDAVLADTARWPDLLARLHTQPGSGPESDRAAHAACAVFHHIAATLHELDEVHP